MNLQKDIKLKWNIFKRNKRMWLYLFLIFIVLSLFDKKGNIFFDSKFLYIYRFLSQQIYTAFTIIFFVNIFINENELENIKNFMVIYIKNIKKEIRLKILISIFLSISAFFIGNLLLCIINFLVFFQIPFLLFIVNFIISSIQIITLIFFIFGLRLVFKKNIFVFSIYYIYIFFSLILSSIWFSIPLNIKLIGDEGLGYYTNYDIKLWISRIFLLIISILIYLIGERKMLKNI